MLRKERRSVLRLVEGGDRNSPRQRRRCFRLSLWDLNRKEMRPQAPIRMANLGGKNILIERHTVAETAKQFPKSEDEVHASVTSQSGQAARGSRPTPAPASRRQDHYRLEWPDDLSFRSSGADS